MTETTATVTDENEPIDECLRRAEKQLHWYSSHARKARLSYQILEVFQIGTGATIPLAAAVHWPIGVSAALGTAIAIAGGVRSVFRWQSNWVAWSTTAGKMHREISLYEAGVAPYDSENRGQLLVKNVEDLTVAETLQWADQAQKSDRSSQPIG